MKVFLSYSRGDARVAADIRSRLLEDGHDVWIDTADVRGGDRWREVVVREIDKSDTVVVLLSDTSVASDNVQTEAALARDRNKRVVPVRHGDPALSGSLAYLLAGVHHIDLNPDREAGLEALALAVNGDPAIDAGPAEPGQEEHPPEAGGGRGPLVLLAVGSLVVAAVLIAAVIASERNGTDDDPEGVAGPSTAAEDDQSGDEVGQFCEEARGGSRILAGADLLGCDLSGLDLSGVDLSSTQLGGASLRGADLSDSLLAKTDLRDADLTDATVTGAHLYRAELAGAVGVDELDWAGTLVERSVCDNNEPCEFAAATVINRSLATCSADDYKTGAPIAAEAMGIDLTWLDSDGDCLHDTYERTNGTLVNDEDTNDNGLIDSIDDYGGSEKPLALYSQFQTMEAQAG